MAVLPPTRASSRQRFLRVYLQVQEWHGVDLPPTQWGWMEAGFTLLPVPTKMEPAPKQLLELISCNCKGGSTTKCDCRKSGLAYIAQQCADSAAGCHVLALSNCVVVNLTQTMTIPMRLWMSVMLNRQTNVLLMTTVTK
jgi:hypothetical protein